MTNLVLPAPLPPCFRKDVGGTNWNYVKPMKQIDLREGARRQHRTIALFAVVQCWTRGLDGLVFQRLHLERLIGIQRFRDTRVRWLLEDLAEFFPHQQKLVSGTESFASLFVSRSPLSGYLPTGEMRDKDRIARVAVGGPKLGIFWLWPTPKPDEEDGLDYLFDFLGPVFKDSVNRDERMAATCLGLLAQGLIGPKELLGPLKPKEQPVKL